MLAAFFLWNRYRDRSAVRLQLLWTAILFAPAVLGVFAFVREDWVHDRHMYLVSVPICLLAAVILTDPRWPTKASVIASSVVLAILLADTAIQVPKFSDNVTIYTSALKVAPRNVLAHDFYAAGLWSYGRREEGLQEYKICTELAPRASTTHAHYGAALAEMERDDEAGVEFAKALQLSPRPTAYRAYQLSQLAGIELKHSEYTEAADHLREAVQIAPQSLNYHSALAQALRHQGFIKEADEEMQLEASIRLRFVQEMRASKD
jgi:tetratricopeptide (TPR) repeat protein